MEERTGHNFDMGALVEEGTLRDKFIPEDFRPPISVSFQSEKSPLPTCTVCYRPSQSLHLYQQCLLPELFEILRFTVFENCFDTSLVFRLRFKNDGESVSSRLLEHVTRERSRENVLEQVARPCRTSPARTKTNFSFCILRRRKDWSLRSGHCRLSLMNSCSKQWQSRRPSFGVSNPTLTCQKGLQQRSKRNHPLWWKKTPVFSTATLGQCWARFSFFDNRDPW